MTDCRSDESGVLLVLLGLLLGEALLEGAVGEDECDLVVTLLGFGLAFAVVAAEGDRNTSDLDFGLGIRLATGERATLLDVLAGVHQLMIGLGGVLLDLAHRARGALLHRDLPAKLHACLALSTGAI